MVLNYPILRVVALLLAITLPLGSPSYAEGQDNWFVSACLRLKNYVTPAVSVLSEQQFKAAKNRWQSLLSATVRGVAPLPDWPALSAHLEDPILGSPEGIMALGDVISPLMSGRYSFESAIKTLSDAHAEIQFQNYRYSIGDFVRDNVNYYSPWGNLIKAENAPPSFRHGYFSWRNGLNIVIHKKTKIFVPNYRPRNQQELFDALQGFAMAMGTAYIKHTVDTVAANPTPFGRDGKIFGRKSMPLELQKAIEFSEQLIFNLTFESANFLGAVKDADGSDADVILPEFESEPEWFPRLRKNTALLASAVWRFFYPYYGYSAYRGPTQARFEAWIRGRVNLQLMALADVRSFPKSRLDKFRDAFEELRNLQEGDLFYARAALSWATVHYRIIHFAYVAPALFDIALSLPQITNVPRAATEVQVQAKELFSGEKVKKAVQLANQPDRPIDIPARVHFMKKILPLVEQLRHETKESAKEKLRSQIRQHEANMQLFGGGNLEDDVDISAYIDDPA